MPSHPRTSAELEADRVRQVFAGREASGLGRRYRADRPENLAVLHQLERVLLTELRARCPRELDGLEVLDVGCGAGGVLVRLLGHGADPARLHGVDLREDAIALARTRLPSADLRVGDAAELPYPDDSMDLVLQFTTLSSILDARVRRTVAQQMMRVVARDGLIVSYDFWINPLNRDTRALTGRQLRALFADHRVDTRLVTLAPPIGRLAAGWGYGFVAALQTVPVLRTHYLAFISAPRSRASPK
jgi:ubiquinone/menaquinone biosynthesis C-methylase UbiE